MSKLYKLKFPIGTTYSTDPEDVLVVKTALNELGYYEKPEWGITPYPDEALFNAVKSFQADKDLKVDGILKPGGPTEKVLAARSPSLRCTNCGAFHGGVFSTKLCSDCYGKLS